ncbi:MAG: SGNH/GDSL hydrolase family protein [Chromatiales bacterium]|nr:MAG: SGNH/GDSL hydrolase family protein [Chromatiales bacterium]
MQGQIRKYLPPLTAILLGFLVALVLAEVSVRIFFPHSRDHVMPGQLFRMDPDLGWSLRNGTNGQHQTRLFDVEYRVNAFGYRDRERERSKKPGVKRVFLYGDSQAFGWGLPMEGRYSNLLENRIANVEIWNLAVPGYGLDQELLSFERDAKQFAPDLVLFFASRDTLPRTRHRIKYYKYKPQFLVDDSGALTLIPVPATGRLVSDFLYRLIGWSYLPYFVERRLKILKSKLQTEKRQERVFGTSRKLNERILLRARDAADASGIPMAIVSPAPVAERYGLEAFCNEQGIGLLRYELNGSKDDWVLGPTDHHYNRRASEAIADQIEPQLRMLLASGRE